MLFWIRVVVAAAVLASVARAEAMCAPQFWVGTPDGSTIPTHGSLYVYSNAYELLGDYPNRRRERVPLTVKWVGRPGTVEQTEVSPNVIKVSYQGEAGSQLVLRASYGPARYKLANSWRAPAVAPTARSFEHDEMDGGCPSWNVLRVALDQPTAAIRVRWTFADVTSEWVLPPEGDVIQIGRQSCGGSTVPTDQLAVGGHLELIAIRLDGSEVAVRGVPSIISFDDVATSSARAELEDALRKLRDAKTPRELPDSGDDERVIIISLLLLVAGVGLASWWLRRALDRLR